MHSASAASRGVWWSRETLLQVMGMKIIKAPDALNTRLDVIGEQGSGRTKAVAGGLWASGLDDWAHTGDSGLSLPA